MLHCTLPTTSMLIHTKKIVDVVKEYMRLAYSPQENKGARQYSIFVTMRRISSHPPPSLTAGRPRTTLSPSKAMACVSNIHINSYDVIFAKGEHVCLRYSASGSHNDEPHNDIEATGNKAAWHAAAIFDAEDGKIKG